VLPCRHFINIHILFPSWNKGDHQVTKDIGKTHFHNANFNNPDTKKNFTIPVTVKGQALTRKSNPVNRQSSRFSSKKDRKVLIMGCSHTRFCATNIKSEIKDNYDVRGLVKPGAGADMLENTANSDIANLTKNDVATFCGGANDAAKTNPKRPLRHVRNSTKSNNYTNIILVSAPCGYDLMQPWCVNDEIRSFNRNLMKSARAYQHVSILEMSSDRKLFYKSWSTPKWPRKVSAIQTNSLPRICNGRPGKGPPDNLKLEFRSKFHRYATSRKSYK